MRRNIGLSIKDTADHERAILVAQCIKKMEEQPALKAGDLLAELIAERVQGDAKAAALMGMRCGHLSKELSDAGEGKYLDLSLSCGPAFKGNIGKAAMAQLEAILGEGRVRLGWEVEREPDTEARSNVGGDMGSGVYLGGGHPRLRGGASRALRADSGMVPGPARRARSRVDAVLPLGGGEEEGGD